MRDSRFHQTIRPSKQLAMTGNASPAPSSDHGNHSTSSDESAEEEEEPNIELLVTGRAKRATAGNRLSSLLEKEGDDELELLFAENEEEEDVEFEDDEDHASDAQLDSSTDEEDQSPTKVDDDLDGERELQRQDKLERQKKRKAQDVFKTPGALRKKVKIDPSATTPAPRPRKKSERVSWRHTDADAPTRASSRKQTVQNREMVHQKLLDGEQTRLKIVHDMDVAQKLKDASKPKALTQADRMEEAAKTERKNAKSLNRWEESEKKRSEEQRAKLEALHNRQLAGPVVTWWSGLAGWVNGKILQLGVRQIREAGHVERSVTLDEGKSALNSKSTAEREAAGTKTQDTTMSESSQSGLGAGYAQRSQQITFTLPQSSHGFLDGIHAYAALPMQQHQAEFTGTADADSLPQKYPEPSFPNKLDRASLATLPDSHLRPEVDFTSLTLVALKNLDPNPMKMPELQNSVLLKKRNVKIPSEETTINLLLFVSLTFSAEPVSESCAITMQPAKFRDPKTGLAYANSYAYKEVQRLRTGGSRWSNLLDCYVGPVQSVARGVPERFWKETRSN